MKLLYLKKFVKESEKMNIEDKLVKKSEEAFLLAVETFNKPTIVYRLEAFAFLICNAWELMLKAYMIKIMGEKSIYYKDSERTLSLENCIKKVFTNKKDPLRLNLEKIVELRNTSTHFITEEYEMIYVPLFQSCLFNYNEKMLKFHNVDITEIVHQNFLTLTPTMKSFNQTEIIAKYPEEIATKLIKVSENIRELVNTNNNNFAIKIEHFHYITKDISKATSIIAIDNSSEASAKIIRELKNPNDTHKYPAKNCIHEINKLLKKYNINMKYRGESCKFNKYHFTLFCSYFCMKENPKLCFKYGITNQPMYSYSYQAIEFIFEEIKKDPKNILDNIKNKLKK